MHNCLLNTPQQRSFSRIFDVSYPPCQTILHCSGISGQHSTTIVYSTYCSNVAFSGIKSSLIFQLQKSIVNMYFTFNFTCTTVYSTLHSNVAFLAFLMSLIHLARRFYFAPVFRPHISLFLISNSTPVKITSEQSRVSHQFSVKPAIR